LIDFMEVQTYVPVLDRGCAFFGLNQNPYC
jgi:hypothetical protein